MKAVTTFSPEGYEQYGRKCLESLIENWPSEIVVFYERKPDLVHEKLIYRDISTIPERDRFLKLSEKVPESAGYMRQSDGTIEYNFMRDSRKYCHKVFAQMAVDDDLVFWVDADTFVFKPIPEDYLRGLLVDVPYCFFGRDTYTETGFLGFNTQHRMFRLLKQQYLNCYARGVIFQLLGWHDCFAFDFARIGLAGRNLSPAGKGVDHVIAESELGQYLDHMKGARKSLGHSPEQKVKWWENAH